MADIKLTPEELMTQAQEMTSLQGEFESLFGQVSTALEGMNDSWSENLASNFAGKITAAQKTFTSVTNMLGNGALVASKSASTFSEPENLLGILATAGGGLAGAIPDSLKKLFEKDGIKLKSNSSILTDKEKQDVINMLPPEMRDAASQSKNFTKWLSSNYDNLPDSCKKEIESSFSSDEKTLISITKDVLTGEADMDTLEKGAAYVTKSGIKGNVIRSAVEAGYNARDNAYFNQAYANAENEAAAAMKKGDVGGTILGATKMIGAETGRFAYAFGDTLTNMAGYAIKSGGAKAVKTVSSMSSLITNVPVAGEAIQSGVQAAGNFFDNVGNLFLNAM